MLNSFLDAATLSTMLRSTLEALPIAPGSSAEDIVTLRQAVLFAILALRPRDPIEAMLAARIVCAHNASVECFRRAALPDVDDDAMLRLSARAIALGNFASRTQRELRQLQAVPPADALSEQDQPATAPRQAGPAATAQPSPVTADDPQDPAPLPASTPQPAATIPLIHPAVTDPATPAEALRTRTVDDMAAKARPPVTECAPAAQPLAA